MWRPVSSRWIPVAMASGTLLIALALGGCAPDARAAILSPGMRDALVAEEAGQVVVAEPTAPPPVLAELSGEEIYAGLPEDLAAAVAAANLENGAAVSLARGCVGCHSLDPAATMTGPTWHNIGDTAIVRVPGEGPAEYLHQSIVAPNDYVVPNFPANIMPPNYGELLSTQELADVIAYLLAQSGQAQ